MPQAMHLPCEIKAMKTPCRRYHHLKHQNLSSPPRFCVAIFFTPKVHTDTVVLSPPNEQQAREI